MVSTSAKLRLNALIHSQLCGDISSTSLSRGGCRTSFSFSFFIFDDMFRTDCSRSQTTQQQAQMITILYPILICSVTRICQSSTTGITFSRWSHYYANKSDAASPLEGISFMYNTGTEIIGAPILVPVSTDFRGPTVFLSFGFSQSVTAFDNEKPYLVS